MMQNTTDIWFTAFLMYKNEKIVKYDVITRGKVRCYFDITDDKWAEFKLEFNNSEIIRFKALTEQIKDLGY
jgi:hypothetical protein